MKKVKHPHRKALIRQKHHKRKPYVSNKRCDQLITTWSCYKCPYQRAGFQRP